MLENLSLIANYPSIFSHSQPVLLALNVHDAAADFNVTIHFISQT